MTGCGFSLVAMLSGAEADVSTHAEPEERPYAADERRRQVVAKANVA